MIDCGEDLLRIAIRAAELAPELCHGCRDYHLSWPAFRLIETTGLDSDRPFLLPLFRTLAQEGRRRWMVAGMADSGLAATVSAAVWPVSSDAVITLVDRCQTPLTLCRELVANGRAFHTVPADLLDFRPGTPQDVIIAHSILSHLAVEARTALVRRFRQWLGAEGRLVLCARIDDRLDTLEETSQRSQSSLEAIRDALRLKGVDDDGMLDRQCAAIAFEFAVRNTRRGVHPSANDVVDLLHSCGFATVETVADYAPPPRLVRPSGRRARRAILLASVC